MSLFLRPAQLPLCRPALSRPADMFGSAGALPSLSEHPQGGLYKRPSVWHKIDNRLQRRCNSKNFQGGMMYDATV